MSNWETIPNPAFDGLQPQRFTVSDCHDHSHFVTVQCACGEQMHMHQTQWARANGQAIGSQCHGCGQLLVFPPGHFDQVLDQMRTDGWIA